MTANLFDSSASSSSASGWSTAHCDGGSRGNPGPAGYGAVVENPEGVTVARLSGFIGIHTNNVAEYSGLLAVLNWAIENGATRLRVISDSELMVKQMQGKYKVASPSLRPLWEEARKLSRQLEGFQISHTLRGGNKEADRLANEAMDKGMGKAPNRDQASATGVQGPAASKNASTANGPAQPSAAQAPPKAPRQILEGFVKNGVVHLLGGQLPDGVFVKIIRE
jgi:probable phosphoglycerate mutase